MEKALLSIAKELKEIRRELHLIREMMKPPVLDPESDTKELYETMHHIDGGASYGRQ